MPFPAAREASLAFFLASLSAALSTLPHLAFPINSQLPPVAYAYLPYHFEFAAGTFESDTADISYAISSGPQWLTIDGARRSLSGTPDLSDVGSTTFLLTATTSSGQASTTVTLVVLESISLTAGDILPQLEKAGPCSWPASILLRPGQQFALPFLNSTFNGATANTSYYAASADSSPLPSWVQFDTRSLRFAGTSPPILSPTSGPQRFGIRLIATNVPGFSEASVNFSIVVGHHVLAFSVLEQTIEASQAERFQSSPMRDSLTLDGRPIRDDEILNIVTDASSGVVLDTRSISLGGLSSAQESVSFTISVTDIYKDTANTSVKLMLPKDTYDFESDIVRLSVTIGESFSYSLREKLPNFQVISIELGSKPDWLHFDEYSQTLYGIPPTGVSPHIFSVSFTLEDDESQISQIIQLTLVNNLNSTLTPSSSSTPKIATSTQDLPQASLSGGSTNKSKSNAHVAFLILTIALPITGAIVLTIILLYIRSRRTKRKNSVSIIHEEPATFSESNSRRASTSLAHVGPTSNRRDCESTVVQVQPPKIELSWSGDSIEHSKHRYSQIKESEKALPHSDLAVKRLPSTLALHSNAVTCEDIRTQLSGRRSRTDAVSGPGTLARRSLIGIPTGPSRAAHGLGIADSQASGERSSILGYQPQPGLALRDSGAGHGSGVLAKSSPNVHTAAWRMSAVSNLHEEPRQSTTILDSFPLPPVEQEERISRLRSKAQRGSVISDESVQALSLDQRRQRWHTERARARLEGAARFSNAGSLTTAYPPKSSWKYSRKALGAEYSSARETDIYLNKENLDSRGCKTTDSVPESSRKRALLGSYSSNVTKTRGTASIASSGQFDSAASTDSQWNGEDLIAELVENARQWQTDGVKVSPRPQFECGFDNAGGELPISSGSGIPREPAVQGSRTPAGDESLVAESRGSYKASFRFV